MSHVSLRDSSPFPNRSALHNEDGQLAVNRLKQASGCSLRTIVHNMQAESDTSPPLIS